MSVFVQQQGVECDFTRGDSWVILSPIEQSIKHKIETIGTPLKNWDINIYRGVLTGYNDAFIISTEKRNEILANCQNEEERQKTAELIRPILRGRDIKRYGYNWANLWIINTHNGINGKLPRVNVNEYPAIKVHLDQYWDKILNRIDKGDTPYNLRNCAYLEDFSKPKIVWIELTDESKFALSTENIIPLNTVFFMVGKYIKYILAVLNSSLIHWYYTLSLGTRSGVGTNRWLKYTVECIPIPPLLLDEKYWENLVDNISSPLLSNECRKDLDDIINKQVCFQYGLTTEEIHYIENNI